MGTYRSDPQRRAAYHRAYYRKNKARVAAYQREWNTKNAERVKAAHRAYYLKNKAAILARQKTAYLANPEQRKEYGRRYHLKNRAAHLRKCAINNRKRKYGLTHEEQINLLSKPCGICGGKATHVDHNHQTKQIRGALCLKCNAGLGMFRDDLNLILCAAAYLKKGRR